MSADEAKTEDKFAGKNSISETPEEIKNVRKSLQAGGFQDIMLDEMAKHCPGMGYEFAEKQGSVYDRGVSGQ